MELLTYKISTGFSSKPIWAVTHKRIWVITDASSSFFTGTTATGIAVTRTLIWTRTAEASYGIHAITTAFTIRK